MITIPIHQSTYDIYNVTSVYNNNSNSSASLALYAGFFLSNIFAETEFSSVDRRCLICFEI